MIPPKSSSSRPEIDPSIRPDRRLVAKLAREEQGRDQQQTAEQARRDQRQLPTIAVEQGQVEEREEARHDAGHDRAGDLLEDLAEAHRPQGQVARGEPGEEPAREPEQAVPDGRDQRGRDPPLDAQDHQALDRLEDRGRDGQDRPGNRTCTASRDGRVRRSPARSASGMTWSTRMPEAIGIDRPSRAPRRPSSGPGPARRAVPQARQKRTGPRNPERSIGERPVEDPGGGAIDAASRSIDAAASGRRDRTARSRGRDQIRSAHGREQGHGHSTAVVVRELAEQRLAAAAPPVIGQRDRSHLKAGRPGPGPQRRRSEAVGASPSAERRGRTSIPRPRPRPGRRRAASPPPHRRRRSPARAGRRGELCRDRLDHARPRARRPFGLSDQRVGASCSWIPAM